MLEFLPYLAMGAQAMGALSAAQNTAKGYQQTAAEKAQLQSMANRDRLLQAYLNPTDNITKNLTAQETSGMRDEFQRALSNLLSANRKQQLMGRQTYFNPERQDEAISQFLTRGSDLIANTARSNALKRILDAAGGYRDSASSYGGMIPNQQNAQSINANRKPALFGALGDALGSGGSLSNIFAMLGNGGARTDLGTSMPWLTAAA